MIKYTFIFILLVSLLGCGKSSHDSSSNPLTSSSTATSETETQDSTGANSNSDVPLEVSNSEMVDEYSPVGLSEKVFVKNDITYAPMDLITQNLTMTFDPDSQTAKGHSVITFRIKKKGKPYFELKATAKNVKLNSSTTTATSVTDPDGQNQTYIAVNQEVSPGVIHKVEFDYELASTRVSFLNDGVRFLTDMTDLSGKFFEYWGPVGFEEDAFVLNLSLKVVNSSSTHSLYTNGTVTSTNSSNWKITFPNYYSKSSFYVHLTNQTLPSKKFVYKGLKKDIPVEVYGLTTTLVNSAVSQLPKLFAELEGDYGPYPHEKFLAYMNDRSGGMEYVAATITALGSLDHELLHSWFARSVIPADGRSGWIDEGIASWRDYGYKRATTTLQRNQTNLADYSPYRKTTPSNSYVDGRALMAELDLEFSSLGGLKPVLKAFHEKYRHKVVNNEEFWKFLQEYTQINLEEFNFRYALGSAEMAPDKGPVTPAEPSKHPTPLTREEVLRLR